MALDLKARVSLDGSGFHAGLNAVERGARAFVGRVGALFSAGAIAAGMTSLTRKTINFADTIGDLSRRLEVGTDFLQRFQFAAIKSGASVEDLVSVLEQLNIHRLAALGGDAKDLAAFQALGINENQLRTQGADKLLLAIAKAFESGSAQQLIPAFKEIGGRGAGILVASFKEGLEQEMANAPIIPPETIAAIKMVKDEFSVLGQIMAAEFAPALAGLAKKFLEFTYYLRIGWERSFMGNRLKADALVIELNDLLAKFDDKVKAAAQGFAGPQAAQVFEPFTSKTKAATIESEAMTQGDSLVRVGNFLGSNQNAIAKIGERTNQLLVSIDRKMTRLVERSNTGTSIGYGPE